MQITGNNLVMVEDAVRDSIFWLKNENATCPNLTEYAEQIQGIDAEILKRQRLLARIQTAIAKENAT